MQLSMALFLFDYSAQHVMALRGGYGAERLMCDVKNQRQATSDGHKYLISSPLMTIQVCSKTKLNNN